MGLTNSQCLAVKFMGTFHETVSGNSEEFDNFIIVGTLASWGTNVDPHTWRGRCDGVSAGGVQGSSKESGKRGQRIALEYFIRSTYSCRSRPKGGEHGGSDDHASTVCDVDIDEGRGWAGMRTGSGINGDGSVDTMTCDTNRSDHNSRVSHPKPSIVVGFLSRGAPHPSCG
jgi:hypothetical protein